MSENLHPPHVPAGVRSAQAEVPNLASNSETRSYRQGCCSCVFFRRMSAHAIAQLVSRTATVRRRGRGSVPRSLQFGRRL